MSRRPCLAKRLYSQATPYIQIGGWLVVAVPALYTAFTFYSQVQAYDGEIKKAAQQIIALEQWRGQQAQDMATLKEGIDTLKTQNQQIYSALIRGK